MRIGLAAHHGTPYRVDDGLRSITRPECCRPGYTISLVLDGGCVWGANSGTLACFPAIQRKTYTFLGSVRPCGMRGKDEQQADVFSDQP
jgi:hypothetical protein